ncbi:MAG: site-specific integrase [Burkholderiales bacterium]
MGKLRERMKEEMVLRGMSTRTHQSYLSALEALTRHHGVSPDTLNEEQIRGYVLHLLVERKLSASSVNVAVSAIRFFFGATLHRRDMHLELPRPKPPKKLPYVLSRQEVAHIIEAARDERERTMFMLAYAAGLRVSELCSLRVGDIDSERMCLRVQLGKGAKDRDTLLSKRLLDQLRRYWREYHPAYWVFPGSRDPRRPMDEQIAQRAFRAAKGRAGVTKPCNIHGLRHAFATHLLESGVDIHTIQRLMGHSTIQSTLTYFHLARERLSATASPLDLLELTLPPTA